MNEMFDMVKEVRRMTQVFEEAHSDLKRNDVRSSIMTALLGIFIEYALSCGLSVKSIRGAAEFAFKKYENIV
jgi:hypothetical protein